MKRVVLLRHGKSSWSHPSLDDHDRPLAPRGVKDAKRVAEFIAKGGLRASGRSVELGESGREQLVEVDLVLCSSALRARQTWAQVQEQIEPRFGVRITHELYMPSLEALVRCLRQVPARANSVLVVGHNPSLEALALMLARRGDAALRAHLLQKFPTAALCIIELDKEGELEGRLSLFVTPGELKSGARTAREPTKAGAIELERKPRWRDTALRVFDATSSQLRENAAGARHGKDPEYVHQMRVGVRRLRTALSFFRGVMPEQINERLRRELRWLFGLLGPPREYDVVLEQVLSPVDATAGLSVLRESLESQRRELLAKLAVAIDSPRFERLVRALLDLQAQLAQRDELVSPKLRARARKRLEKRLRKVRRLQDAIDDWLANGGSADLRKVDVLHALRKELKKLRYACEFVHDAFAHRATKRYLRRLSALQDVLGELQDNSASERLLASHIKLVPGRELRASLRAHLQTPLDAAAIQAASVLAQRWEAFKRAEPFWL